MALYVQPDEHFLLILLEYISVLCCVRLTGNMVCNLQIAIEVAVASMASNVDIEDGPTLNKRL